MTACDNRNWEREDSEFLEAVTDTRRDNTLRLRRGDTAARRVADLRQERRVRTGIAEAHAFEVNVGALGERVVRLQTELMPVSRVAARDIRERQRAQRVRIGVHRANAERRRQVVAFVDFNVVDARGTRTLIVDTRLRVQDARDGRAKRIACTGTPRAQMLVLTEQPVAGNRRVDDRAIRVGGEAPISLRLRVGRAHAQAAVVVACTEAIRTVVRAPPPGSRRRTERWPRNPSSWRWHGDSVAR